MKTTSKISATLSKIEAYTCFRRSLKKNWNKIANYSSILTIDDNRMQEISQVNVLEKKEDVNLA